MKITHSLRATLLVFGLLLLNISCSAETDNTPHIQDLSQRWGSMLAGVQISTVKPSSIPGIWEVHAGTHVFYTNQAGDQLIIGDLITMEKNVPVNLTELKRAELRIGAIKALSADNFITYPAPKAQHHVYVFTDPDCIYCRKFHAQRDELAKAGITMHYLPMPRGLAGTESYTKAIAIWCATDQRAAFSAAVVDKFTDNDKTCAAGEKIVANSLALARNLGANGTPTMILADGKLIPGFLPAADLLHYLTEQTPNQNN